MTDYVVYPSAHVDRPDNRGKSEPTANAIVINMSVGKNQRYVPLRFSVRDARLLAESLLTAARLLEEHP